MSILLCFTLQWNRQHQKRITVGSFIFIEHVVAGVHSGLSGLQWMENLVSLPLPQHIFPSVIVKHSYKMAALQRSPFSLITSDWLQNMTVNNWCIQTAENQMWCTHYRKNIWRRRKKNMRKEIPRSTLLIMLQWQDLFGPERHGEQHLL